MTLKYVPNPDGGPMIIQDDHDWRKTEFVLLSVLFLAMLSRPMRWWTIQFVIISFAAMMTIERPSYVPDGGTVSSFFGHGNHFPWYCILLWIAWFYWLFVRWPQAFRAGRRLRDQQEADQWASGNRQQMAVQNAYEADRQATAKATGDAVVDAMRRAYQETGQGSPQARQEPSQARSRHRNVIDVPALPPGPQRPTAPPQQPAAPTGPVGSGSPTLWVPTYSGPAKPVQRRETTLGGISIVDRRGVDPDGL